MLTARQNSILKLIIEKYIKEAKPIGSKVISKALKCSSATVRNEMAALENAGLLEKTHTSSGRVPSEAGYRYYVDNLMELKKMNAEDMLKLQIVFRNQQLALSDVITKSLQVISDITNYTTVVLGSTSHENLLKQIEVVPIDDASMIVIIVTDKGHVEHKNIKLQDVSLDEVKKTVGLINNLITGTPIDEVSKKLEYEIKPIIGKYVKQHEQLYNAFYHVFNDFTNQEVNVVGRHKILEQPEFSTNIEKIKNIYNKLEDKEVLQRIEEDDDNNIKVYIGTESNIDDDVTVIKTKFKTDTEEGTIAIIGPKRMEYDQVVSMLEYMRENIER
ncbi:MAG: heat-inducible transcriptional repressor HrcA [Bacilli bacterium]|nr:heat-inducible transcriptional repressor HrcA [bacterium]MDY2697695.1 heat-inducible transcriptional repressor HrcA [Bacilli bacterium]MDY5992390.1 heat-inducible transcriptional repressor HrcA [Bacilli bacterium]MEE0014790.1 heat-inducible transcriptional repressor HrcA [Bacilli bacterium]